MEGTLLVAGASSDAGKSVVTTGICRWLHRRGVKVTPYKAQNMSNNSMVAADGVEIGRAQWIQAIAAGATPEAAMNPVLLKLGGDRRSHLVVMGQPAGELDATAFGDGPGRLADVAYAAFDDLRERYDAVICEGAGSPAEINLRRFDYVNLGLARHGRIPTVVVGDIDRGGVFASLFGTVALLDAADQALVAGFVINKFRGDRTLLRPGLDQLRDLTGRPTLGVLAWEPGLWLDSEDALDLDGRRAVRAESAVLRVAVVRLPRISNFTDLDPLGVEPDVEVRFMTSSADVRAADLVIVPGSRSTVADLAWLRQHGFADALAARAREGRPILGICGGFQMLGTTIADPDRIESDTATVRGLGLLPVTTRFDAGKTLRRPRGSWRGASVDGYEIHHGRVTVDDGEDFPGGCRVGPVSGTLWHGSFESDEFRRAFLADVADAAGVPGFIVDPRTSFAAAREHRIDRLADLIDAHLDTTALLSLIEHGAPADLPFVPPGAPSE
ncbi:MAG: cobyric acid synthase [Nocardioidaceae bacterium]